MMGYIVRRALFTIPMLIGISFITYLTIFLAPGGPAAGIMQDLNPKVSAEYKQKMVEHFQFDKPVHVQYFSWLKRMVRLDFGNSYKDNQPVWDKIKARLPRTILLATMSLVITFVLAVPIGIFSALHRNSLWDKLTTVFVFLGYAMPTTWLAFLLMIGVGIHLGWLPLTGFRSIMADEMTFFQQILDIAKHLILPLIVISVGSLAGLSRYVRHGFLEVIQQDYIRAARAKGLPENRVVMVHALRNTMIPVITIIGMSLPELISSSVIIETIFSYPGLGRLAYEAAMSRDTFLIMPTVTLSAFLTLLGNLIADVCYAYADPRIRYK